MYQSVNRNGSPLLCRVVVCVWLVAPLLGCSFQARPDALKEPKAAANYVEDHCQNGSKLRTLNAETQADQTIGETDKAAAEQLQLDREAAICSELSNDPWIAQLTKLWSLGDSGIDDHSCLSDWNEMKGDTDTSPEAEHADWSTYYDCLAASAEVRLRAEREIERTTPFADVRKFSAALAQTAKADEDNDSRQGEHPP